VVIVSDACFSLFEIVGPGVPEKHLKDIFQPFFRTESV